MNFEETFPLRVYLNLGVADERRQSVEWHFHERGLQVRRQAAVNATWLRGDNRGYASVFRRAQAMSQRLVLRRARLGGADAVFMFEDDVVLAPDWRERVAGITLPSDWGVFYLGCLHLRPPVRVAENLVRCTLSADHHAIGFRMLWLRDISRAMRGRVAGREDPNRTCDIRLAELFDRIPAYAAWPNLAWQSGKDANTNYDEAGRQVLFQEAVAGLQAEEAPASNEHGA